MKCCRSLFLVFGILLGSCPWTSAQYFSNPSFEGTPQMHQPPPGWTPCDPKSTPDTQPGIWGHTKPASDGDTYLSMVTRGPWGGNANSTEDIEAHLLTPLSNNECYTLSIDLSTCDYCGHDSDIGWISYANPAYLDVYASFDACGKDELIVRIGPVNHVEWKTYTFTFSPKRNGYNHLLLKAAWIELPEYFGTVLLDNIRVEKTTVQNVILDQSLEPGDTIRLEASEGSSYLWSPASMLSCNDCQSPTATFLADQAYTVIIRDSSNICPWREVFRLWTNSSVFVPNAFTPDGDGLNDQFGAFFSGNLIQMNLKIFNRFGNLIFETTKPDQFWDGRMNGGIVPAGVYTWKLDYEVFIRKGRQKFSEAGMVTVLR